jgi:site-specific DNA recombinase
MLTHEEFERVQKILHKESRPSPEKHYFPFTGLIRCGECGCSITAENKVNRYGKQYIYYHCTKRRFDSRCTQRSITASKLEEGFADFLGTLIIPPKTHAWALKQIDKARTEQGVVSTEQINALEKAMQDISKQIGNLTTLRIRDLLDDVEFTKERAGLVREQELLRERLTLAKQGASWFEPAQLMISFSNSALIWFKEADVKTKRMIIDAVGSNLSLKDKKPFIQAKKPFVTNIVKLNLCTLLAVLKDIRTLHENRDAEFQHTLFLVRHITEVCAKSIPLEQIP